MPRAAHRPPALRGTVFRGRDAVARQLLTARQLRSGAWRRVLGNVYVDAEVEVTHGVRIRAARLAVPALVVAGRSAAWVLGARDLLGPADPVEGLLLSSGGVRAPAGLCLRRVVTLDPGDVQGEGRPWLTSPARTAADVARWAPDVVEAVVRLDVLRRTGVLRDLDEVGLRLRDGRGCRQARQALRWSDGRAESPPESRVRVWLLLAGLDPVPQFVVRRDGRFVARVDLAFPEQRVAVEYDGAYHAEPGQFRRDRRRLNALVAAGWRVIHLTAADLADPAGIVRQIVAALAR